MHLCPLSFSAPVSSQRAENDEGRRIGVYRATQLVQATNLIRSSRTCHHNHPHLLRSTPFAIVTRRIALPGRPINESTNFYDFGLIITTKSLVSTLFMAQIGRIQLCDDFCTSMKLLALNNVESIIYIWQRTCQINHYVDLDALYLHLFLSKTLITSSFYCVLPHNLISS